MRVAFLGVLLAVMIPASANAASPYYIPPGNSGADQYVESVPTAGGSGSTTVINRHKSGGSPSGALTPATQSVLAGQGRDGLQAASFANATAPPAVQARPQPGPAAPSRASKGRRGSTGSTVAAGGGGSGGGGSGGGGVSGGGSGGGGGYGGAPAPAGSSPAATLVRSLTGLGGHGGLGGALPVALIIVLVSVGTIALRRRQVG